MDLRARRVLGRIPGAREAVSLLQTLRFQWRHRGDRPIVLVHQMARVGSVTVFRAIRRNAPTTNLFHTHYLNPASIEHFESQADRAHAATGEPGIRREMLAARWLTARLRGRSPQQPWRIVSLVRDPVARTISAFFRHFPYAFPTLGARFLDDPLHVPRLLELFRDECEFEHEFALNWFDREVRDVFGIDVYATPFPWASGCATYIGDRCDLLVMRLEDLEQVGAAALQEFLGLRDVTLTIANSTDREPYAESYRRFLAELRPTREYLDRVYESRLARHFYSTDERARFRARWSPSSDG